ncbi:pentatricopeptide repeat-containing protein At1g08070, chloroplastic-like [Humulus lupulus]|uniref:pentatricopeptide repeat-containing protein At1g08070, chloroplastic-like n=1 Tax=Humulus lupulus TaxID=3486 RepID=UPI002B403F66|nr:pentatricopeptide repeat-containing protein At1g08070, chloroplastic-like [Humulus lupulus]
MSTCMTSYWATTNYVNSRAFWFASGGPKSENLRNLRQLHAFVLKTTTFPLSLPTLELISSSRNLGYVCFILKHLENQDLGLDLCNDIVRRLSSSSANDNGNPLRAVVLFREMLVNGFRPDNYTVPYALKACSQSRALREGVQVQAYAVKTGLVYTNVYVKNTLIRLYAVCASVSSARKVFDESSLRDVVSWTTLIQCYVKNGFAREAILTFFEMCDAKLKADEKTVVIILSACSKLGDLKLGRKIHDYILDNGVPSDVYVGNALVDMYLKCGDADSAHKIFDEMPVKNVVSWNSLISGLAHQGEFKDAMDMFRKMQSIGVEPDDFTLVGVLNSCANLGLLELGKWVHEYIDKKQIEADGFIGNALVDMYAKCGSIDQAFKVFQGMKRRDVYSYTAIIVGLAMHGEAKRALDIFFDMPQRGIKPDEVTFIGVLTACSHAGLVVEGRKYFTDMSRVYNLRPQTEHYGCMVDLLGRAGLIEEAQELIGNMPMEPDAYIWGALLGACRIYGCVELGEDAMKKLLKVEPERDGAYVLMSNIYSSANKWRDAVKLRKEMKDKNMKKTPGCSSIELDGVVYEFRKGSKSHARSKEIYKLLEEIMSHIKNFDNLAR